MKGLRITGLALLACVLGASVAGMAQSWTSVTPAPDFIGPILQLRDGRILAHVDQGGSDFSHWLILSPDAKGKYETGTWSGPYAMQSGYAPFFFSSALLTDGKTIVVEGGE